MINRNSHRRKHDVSVPTHQRCLYPTGCFDFINNRPEMTFSNGHGQDLWNLQIEGFWIQQEKKRDVFSKKKKTLVPKTRNGPRLTELRGTPRRLQCRGVPSRLVRQEGRAPGGRSVVILSVVSFETGTNLSHTDSSSDYWRGTVRTSLC